ncbi:MAG: tRNA pseudouridine(13) synthase TruD [Phycisphaerae bacterium]
MSTAAPSHPRLLADFNPARGVLKSDFEDFVVEELPLYPADGVGTHAYFLLEKRGLSTMQAISDLARALGVRRMDIGLAGLKDARAVTRQWMSIEHIDPQRLEALSLPRMRVLRVTRHRNKLKLGHLRGNRFEIRVRDTEIGRLPELRAALETLGKLGAPNYFGEQRFGGRGDSGRVGASIVRGSLDDAVDLILGRPGPHDSGPVLRARQLYERGDFESAARAWPPMFRDERHALQALARSGGKRKRAFAAIDHGLRRFYVSAFQSELFNQVVAARIRRGLGVLLDGDLAWVHANGAVFRVASASEEQVRAESFEISPSGPLFGFRMTQPDGEPASIEAAALAGAELTLEAFRAPHLRVKGARRPLRFRPLDADISLAADERGPYLAMQFELPRGCYATTLLRELFVNPGEADGGELGESNETE